MRRAAVAALALAALVAVPASARAEAVTAAQLRVLAAQAATDPAALARLRQVAAVDGRPVDVRAALGGADGADASARARALAAGLDTRGGASGARRQADGILAQQRFHERGLPHPFRGVLHWLGARLKPIRDAIADAFDAVAGVIPGGLVVTWLLIAALLAAGTALAARQLARRRAAAAEERRLAEERLEDPAELERRAAQAEQAGDWEAAVRLRFRAGLLRLDQPPGRTTGEVAARLESLDFDLLGARFDAIAYGGSPAQPDDAEQARERWSRVLSGARR